MSLSLKTELYGKNDLLNFLASCLRKSQKMSQFLEFKPLLVKLDGQ
jgi:hypothetical protein